MSRCDSRLWTPELGVDAWLTCVRRAGHRSIHRAEGETWDDAEGMPPASNIGGSISLVHDSTAGLTAIAQSCSQCRHEKSAHEHFRAGTDCSRCSCAGYRRTHWWRRITPAETVPAIVESDEPYPHSA